jgi:hypothetical protein
MWGDSDASNPRLTDTQTRADIVRQKELALGTPRISLPVRNP